MDRPHPGAYGPAAAPDRYGPRGTRAVRRRRRQVPAVAIAGYTNAGKSSLLNRMTGAGVLVEDALFATLDPTVRRAGTANGRRYPLADTVGFVRHLPHQLVEAFRSTLEEVADADLLLHVVDGSDADPEAQIAAVRTVLGDRRRLVPEIIVINKADLVRRVGRLRRAASAARSSCLPVPATAWTTWSRRSRPGCRAVREVRALVPYERGDLVARVHRLERCSPRSTPPTAPRCTPACQSAWPASWSRTHPHRCEHPSERNPGRGGSGFCVPFLFAPTAMPS